jgi:predicted O-methyltransferase YrrM
VFKRGLRFLARGAARATRRHRVRAEPPPAPAVQPAAPATAPLFAAPGHFYSPVVDPDELRRNGFATPDYAGDLPGVAVDMRRMGETFELMASHMPDLTFPARPSPDWRYFYRNDAFPFADAIVLASVIRAFRPSRIIEVGAGYSSAAMLDTLERTPGLETTHCLFIEPHDGRLRGLLRPGDAARITVMSQPVQAVPLETFDALQAGDLLLLDSTHVAKTGSDVVHEVFNVLPRLRSGVLIHIHDVFAGFEYPRQWIFDENRSWNEIYLLRAFLMHNDAYEVVFFPGAFFAANPERVNAVSPLILPEQGGGLWLRKR